MLFRALPFLGPAATRACTIQAASTIVRRAATSVSCQSSYGTYFRPQGWKGGFEGHLRLQTLPPLSTILLGLPLSSIATAHVANQLRLASSTSNKKPSQIGGSIPTATEECKLAVEPGPSKQCITCHREKLRLDFTTTKTSVDGRADTCRACQAAFHAKRAGRELYHLAWSPELAWERGKVCPLCSVFKEARDFVRSSKGKDELFTHCRSCQSEKGSMYTRERASGLFHGSQTGTPRQCHECKNIKSAPEFYQGHVYLRNCRTCHEKRVAQWRRRIDTSMCLSRRDKVCSTCGEVKSADQFYRSKYSSDGCHPSCNQCHLAMKRKRQEEACE